MCCNFGTNITAADNTLILKLDKDSQRTGLIKNGHQHMKHRDLKPFSSPNFERCSHSKFLWRSQKHGFEGVEEKMCQKEKSNETIGGCAGCSFEILRNTLFSMRTCLLCPHKHQYATTLCNTFLICQLQTFSLFLHILLKCLKCK